MNKNQIHELLGYENIKIIQNEEMFRFSLDSVLLANFIEARHAKKIVDLGTGNAPIPLFLTLKTKAQIIGVEIQEDVYHLANESVKLNNFTEQITILLDDLKGIYQKIGANVFDIVCCNPPYFKYESESLTNKNDFLTIARHEVLVTLIDVVSESTKLLVDGGKFYMVHRVSRLPEIVKVLEEHKFGIRRMQFIYSKVTNKKAMMFLVEARKNKKSDLQVLEPIYVYDENNQYTPQVLEIFNFEKI